MVWRFMAGACWDRVANFHVMRQIVGCVFFIGMLLIARAASPAGAAGDVPLAAGAPAPVVSEPVAGGTFDTTKSGKPYLLEFFAVWCPHCQREVPVMNRLQAVDGGQVDIIAIPASPFGFDHTSVLAPADLQTFAQRFDARYRIGFDGFFSLAYDYGVGSFPTFFVVSADRHITAVETGEVPFETLHAEIQAALLK
jgi:thiol-disulfide isomerase/thioredoxin